MEPIRTTKTAKLGRLKMYREDLDAFVALFRDNCSNVTISDSVNRYVSLDEMKSEAGDAVKKLDIRGDNPAVHFILDQPYTVPGQSTPGVSNELRTEEITDEADLLFLKAKDFLEGRQRPLLRPAFGVIFVVNLFVLGLIVAHEESRGRILAFAIWFIVCIVSLLGTFPITNQITLEKKSASPSFLKRYQAPCP